jgi:hypothetical protein
VITTQERATLFALLFAWYGTWIEVNGHEALFNNTLGLPVVELTPGTVPWASSSQQLPRSTVERNTTCDTYLIFKW